MTTLKEHNDRKIKEHMNNNKYPYDYYIIHCKKCKKTSKEFIIGFDYVNDLRRYFKPRASDIFQFIIKHVEKCDYKDIEISKTTILGCW